MNAPAWYSFQGGKPQDEGISFYEPEQFPWTKQVTDNSPAIRKEIIGLVEQERASMPVYFNKSLVEKGTRWKTFSFMFWGVEFPKNMKRCPETVKILSKIPGIVSYSVSMLEPGSKIKPHRGDTNTIIRCHIPVSIPGTLPDNGFRVADQTREWKEGQVLLFNDAEQHEAWNLSDKERIILILDVIRPEYIDQKKKICTNVLSGLVLQLITSPRFLKPVYKKRTVRLSVQKALYILLQGLLPLFRLFR